VVSQAEYDLTPCSKYDGQLIDVAILLIENVVHAHRRRNGAGDVESAAHVQNVETLRIPGIELSLWSDIGLRHLVSPNDFGPGLALRFAPLRFAPLIDYPEASAFWWPRFERIAAWFASWDRARRDGIATLHAEIKGELKFPVGKREFTLSAIADRIEQRKDGTYAIIDYKTGQARTEKQVRTGLAPQLTLEAAILRGGGFTALRPGSVSEIAYVTLKGGEPAGDPKEIVFKDGTPDTQADHALARLKELAGKFEDAGTPYLSLVHPMWTTHYGDYDHLARVKEWSLTGGADEGGGE